MNQVRVWKVSQSSEGSKIVQKVVHMVYQEQVQKYMNIIKNIQGSRDIYKITEKDYDFGSNKGIKAFLQIKVKKTYSLFIKDL